MDVRMRLKMVRKYRYCQNCLAKSHLSMACPCTDACRICDKYHHTLLHPSIKGRLTKRKPNTRRSTRAPRQRTTTSTRPSITSSPVASERQQRRSTTPSRCATQRINTTSRPNQRIISEAIRSLAEVLCVPPN